MTIFRISHKFFPDIGRCSYPLKCRETHFHRNVEESNPLLKACKKCYDICQYLKRLLQLKRYAIFLSVGSISRTTWQKKLSQQIFKNDFCIYD